MMLHTLDSAEPLSEILAYCRRGDVITHCFSGRSNGVLDKNGNLLQVVRDAQANGIFFDVGHGRGGFSFAAARRALEQGFLPDTLATDISLYAAVDPRFHLPTVMSKLMALGATLEQVVAMVTSRPAQVLGMSDSIGTLQPGASGDVSVLELVEGGVTMKDGMGESLVTSRRLRPFATVRAGEVRLPDSEEASATEPIEWMSHTTVPAYDRRGSVSRR
jgi:dihydroorotase